MRNQLFFHSNHISPINFDDNSLFRRYFSYEGVSHSNSWLYTLRETRDDEGNFGYKYWNKNSLCGIGIRNKKLYIFRPLGDIKVSEIVDICENVTKQISINIILRRIDTTLYEELLSTGLFDKTVPREDLEDDSYPETIIKPAKLFSNNKKMELIADRLGKKARRFEKLNQGIILEKSLKQFSERELIDTIKYMSNGIHDKFTAYILMIKNLLREQEKKSVYRSYIFHDNESIHGIYIIEFLDKSSVGLYCALTSKKYPGITEWIDSRFFSIMFESDIENVYLGGSETQGVFNYIDKLLPVYPSYKMYSLLYSPKKYELIT
jgi:hypothetical protein